MPPLPSPRQSRGTAAGLGSFLTSGTLASRLLGGVLVVLLVSLGLAVTPAPAHANGAGCDDAVLATSEVRIGISCLGNLGTTPTPDVDPDGVGLQYVANDAEAVTQGAVFEGWGVADGATGVTGNVDPGHADDNGGQTSTNLDPVDFTTDGTTAVSVVNVGSTFQVKQDVHPIDGNPNLYEATVSIQNTSSATTDLRYRRVMDWDIPPTPFQELVTLQQGDSQYLQFTSDDGFASADPQAPRTSKLASGSFVRSGPKDHGALFDFDFGALASGATRTFEIYYGAAADESTAMGALASVQAEAFSLGEADGSELDPAQDPGSLNTFIFGFKDISGSSDAVLAPFAVKDKSNIDNDEQATINVLANDSDPRGQQIHVVSSTAAAHGTATCDTATGVCTYTPDTGFTGTDTFSYTIANTSGLTSSAAVAMTVAAAPLNHAPIAGDDTVTVDEDTAQSVNVQSNDFDEDGSNVLTTTVSAAPTHGTVSCTARGVCTYTPNPNFNGTDAFSYTLTDGHGGSDTADVAITVNAVDDAPVAADVSVATDEDVEKDITLTASDVDDATSTLTFVKASDPSIGTVSCTTAGLCTYTPKPNRNGTDHFTYTVSDPHGASDTRTVTVAVAAVNDAPVGQAVSVSTAEDTAATIPLTASDADGDTLTYAKATDPSHGAVTCTGSSCTYTPAPNFHGSDSFDYTVTDGHGGTDTKTVTITVTSVNDAPVAQALSATTAEDTAKAITLSATDVDGDTLTYTAANPSHGTVSCTGTACTYTPSLNYNGSDSFTYTVTDGHGGSDTRTVSLTVTPVNDAPAAVADSTHTNPDTPVSLEVLANDTDVDGDTLTVSGTGTPTNGTVSCTISGHCTFTPAPGRLGDDTFTYTVSDGHGGTATATVTVTTAVNRQPVLGAPTLTTPAGVAGTVQLLAGASDPDGDQLTIAAFTQPVHGAVLCIGATCSYTPAAGYHGPDSFDYTVSDGHGGVVVGTVQVTVVQLLDVPGAPRLAKTKLGSAAVTKALTAALATTYKKMPGTKAAKAKALAKAKAKLVKKKYNLLAGWAAPTYDGGSKITGYKVVLLTYATPKTKTKAGPKSKVVPKLVSKKTLSVKAQVLTLPMKLKPGTYQVQVLAVNGQGTSVPSAMSKTLVIKK